MKPVIILDLDNCIADDGWRIPFINWATSDMDERYDIYHKLAPWDKPGPMPVVDIDAYRIAIFTARPVWLRDLTMHWLIELFGRAPEFLLMRNNSDHRPSKFIKREQLSDLIHHHGIAKQQIISAYDDRLDVVEMYRECAIPAAVHAIHDVCAMTPPSAMKVDATSVPAILRSGADTYEARNAVYGDNYKRVGEVMAALFPDGITLRTPEQYNLWHLFELAIVKMTRFTNSRFEHVDSIHDMTVYTAMVQSLIKEGLFK